MAVSIDRVYQKVLAFANKEQRGYITPQEFNLFADQAQMEIFEQYFYDINQWNRQHGNSHEYSDMLVNLEEKIDIFARVAIGDNVTVLNKYGDVNLNADLPDLYRLGDVRVKYPENSSYVAAERMRSRKEFILYGSSPLTRHAKQRPVYNRYTTSSGINKIKIYPYPVEDDGSPIDLSVPEIDPNLPYVSILNLPGTGYGSTLPSNQGLFNYAEMNTFLGVNYSHNDVETFVIVRNGVVLDTHAVKLYYWQATLQNLSNAPNTGYLRRHPYPTSNAGDFLPGDRLYLPGSMFLDDQRNVQVDYIAKPTSPNWGYVVVNDKALYNSTTSTHFELHQSEESELVYRILAFAGVAIEKPKLTQVAASLEQAKVQQEKQ